MTEGPYKLPEGWRWVRLGEVASKPQYGYTASATTEPKGPKFLRITDITTGEVDWRKVPYCEADEKVLARYALNAGDILFARSGSIGATIVIKDTPPESAVFASYLIRVSLSKEVLPEYMGLLLKAPLCQSQLVPRGAAQRNINAKHIQQLFIPLPPLSEQRRIVARIEELMARVREARRLRKEAKRDTERLMQAALAEVFPRPGSNLPEGWRWVRLGEICQVNPRRRPLHVDPDETTTFVPMTAVDDGTGAIASPEVRPFEQVRRGYTYFEEGDVLFAKITPCMENGKAAIARGLLNGFGFGSTEFHVLRPLDSVTPEWIWLFIRQEPFRKAAKASFRGGVGQQRVPKEFLEAHLIPLPPLSEQRRIVGHLKAVQERIRALQSAQAETDEKLKQLEQSILDRAFRGGL